MKMILIFLLVVQQGNNWNNANGEPFLSGIDVTTYFNKKVPEKGNSKFSAKYAGMIFYFSSQANQKAFMENPEKYLPEYGGWCAYAMGLNGEKVEVDPYTYKLVDNKLYLFYNFYFNNTLKDWDKDEKNLRRLADQNWSNIIQIKK
jgi:YHS domain-containing protein